MCSISGIIYFNHQFSHERVLEQTRLALLQSTHRGPDHSHAQLLSCGAFGHNRLKVIDLSDDANQPMSDPTGRYHLVLNGEIFNHAELRKELEKLGVQFKSKSDTEVLLYALIVYGEECLDKLNGFFSFAFFDQVENKWLIARDRFGEKPLFFFRDSEKLGFASELRSLMQYDILREVDTTALGILLQLSYIPAPSTILKGVQKLMPGHLIDMRFEEDKPSVAVKQWYKPTAKPCTKQSDSATDEKFTQLLTTAVRVRLSSDLPLGCFLSGGVDSSVIASIAVKSNPGLQTFSIGFPDTPFLDESKYALEVAERIGSRHEVFNVSSQAFSDEVENVLQAMDEPFADSSAIAMWMLAQKTKQHIGVALSGDGADELLGGYNKHAALLRSTNGSLLNVWIPNFEVITNLIHPGRTNALSNSLRRLKRYSKGLSKSYKERYLYWSSFSEGTYHEDLIMGFNHADMGARINPFLSDIKKDDFNTVLMAEQKMVLSGDMLPKVDTMSMAHALEVRPPFLDHHVVEFINSLPMEYKMNGRERKILLRDCYAHDLPASVFSRAKKGFEIPLEKMLRGNLKPMVMELLSAKNISHQGLFKQNVVDEVLQDFYQYHRSTHTSLIYSLMVFQVWYKRWFN